MICLVLETDIVQTLKKYLFSLICYSVLKQNSGEIDRKRKVLKMLSSKKQQELDSAGMSGCILYGFLFLHNGAYGFL